MFNKYFRCLLYCICTAFQFKFNLIAFEGRLVKLHLKKKEISFNDYEIVDALISQ